MKANLQGKPQRILAMGADSKSAGLVNPELAKRGAHVPGFRQKLAQVARTDISYWIGGRPEGPPVLLWHGFLGTSFSWHKVMPLLAEVGCSVLAADMRGFGDSAKPPGIDGYDGSALAEEFRALVKQINFGSGRPLTIAAHDMGAPPALLSAAHYPAEIATLLYIEAPVMLEEILSRIIVYTREAMKNGSMWRWLLPLASGVPERLIVGNERAFLTWFYQGATVDPGAIEPSTVDEYLRSFSGEEGVLGALGVYRAAFTTIDQTSPLNPQKGSGACHRARRSQRPRCEGQADG
jgi:pimeloyl-ACP methyl ester carboxylesterase